MRLGRGRLEKLSQPGGDDRGGAAEQVEHVPELRRVSAVRVGDVPVAGSAQDADITYVADVAEQPDPVTLADAGHPAQVGEVAGVHGEEQVALRQPRSLDLPGPVG